MRSRTALRKVLGQRYDSTRNQLPPAVVALHVDVRVFGGYANGLAVPRVNSPLPELGEGTGVRAFFTQADS
jgi:hypothetical protein